MEEKILHQCPHLGILDDPSTSHSFPSSWNACFHAKVPSVPNFEHQETICLTDAYFSCPVYQAAKGSVFPANLQNTVKAPRQLEQSRARVLFTILGVILFLGLAGGVVAALVFKFPDRAGLPVISGPGQEETKVVLTSTPVSALPVATAEFTLTTPAEIATATITPTSAPVITVLKPFPLETVFEIGDQDFLIHRIQDGDVLDLLAKKHYTTSEIIQKINYLLKVPIRAGTLMVIRPDLTTLDPADPIFEMYLVVDKVITLEDLAKKLNVDLTRLKYYNICTDHCIVNRDDWVLVPRHQ